VPPSRALKADSPAARDRVLSQNVSATGARAYGALESSSESGDPPAVRKMVHLKQRAVRHQLRDPRAVGWRVVGELETEPLR
jgi:hypothetical protein